MYAKAPPGTDGYAARVGLLRGGAPSEPHWRLQRPQELPRG